MLTKTVPSEQKLRGGYYTPQILSDFMSKWAIRNPNSRVLEPSCGDGNFLESAVKSLRNLEARDEAIAELITGVEYSDIESAKAWNRMRELGIPVNLTTIVNQDFFKYLNDELINNNKFDVVLGNPPFIKYQDFKEEQRQIAFNLMNEKGFNPNRLTNVWVPFLVLSSFLLSDNGKLAMVVPAELFQVGYAGETRKFLSEFYQNITIITFKKLIWKDAQQEVVLLLCEKNTNDVNKIKAVELDTIEDLVNFDFDTLEGIDEKNINHSKDKWTQYFLSNAEIDLLNSIKSNDNLYWSGDIYKVDVGIVTGQNKFFLLTEEQVINNQIPRENLVNIVSRSSHLEGTKFTLEDWNSNVSLGYPTYMLAPSNVEFEELDKTLQAFILQGEQAKVHEGYKCRIRKRWYIVPSVWIPDAFMLRQVHLYPKLIKNEAAATCTDTIHRVKFNDGFDADRVTVSFLNSLTFAYSEITGRSYGGGVLTFEPSEAERLPLPYLNSENLNIDLLNTLIKENRIDEVLDITDQILLKDGLGLSQIEIDMLRKTWIKMRDRRINRKKGPRT
ncbi:N-6 DNA methylase [Peribacillus butanolivorans]|uniref:N-6 DNA methylase n=1 Tax=Peribacillus butanolivorans TaxID=421767 RepID=UPI0036DB1AD2